MHFIYFDVKAKQTHLTLSVIEISRFAVYSLESNKYLDSVFGTEARNMRVISETTHFSQKVD